jgi:hypothetical protein
VTAEDDVVKAAEVIVDEAHAELLAADLVPAAQLAVEAVEELRARRVLTPGEIELLAATRGALDVVTCMMRGGTVRPCL